MVFTKIMHSSREKARPASGQAFQHPIESEADNLNKRIRKAERDYKTKRELVVAAKVSWCVVLRLSRNSDVEKRLNRRELAYLSADDLRSMSDKALGALRTAVADNELSLIHI